MVLPFFDLNLFCHEMILDQYSNYCMSSSIYPPWRYRLLLYILLAVCPVPQVFEQ